jgi:hypothetical protein
MSAAVRDFVYHTEQIDGVRLRSPCPRNYTPSLRIIRSSCLLTLRSLTGALPELNVPCGPDRLLPDSSVLNRSARFIGGDLADPPVSGPRSTKSKNG